MKYRARIGWMGLLLVTLCGAVAPAENWPAFRGPTAQGVADLPNPPTHWSATENIAWKTAIPGESWSSPIVWGDRIFLTSATDKGVSCRVICINATDGQILWNVEVFKQKPTRKETQNSYATPTPIADGKNVYAFFGEGGAAAVSFDGKVLWTNTDHPFYSRHGFGASPALYDNLLIMSYDISDPKDEKLGWVVPWNKSYILALDARTGKEVWRTPRGMSRQAHGVTRIEKIDGQMQAVTDAGDVIQGLEPQTGKVIWSIKNPGEGVVPSLVFGDGMVFASSGFPTPIHNEKTYAAIRAFKLGGTGDITKNLVWEEKRAVPMIPSFAFYKGMLFAVKEDGMAQCLDARTGRVHWRQRLQGNSYAASPVIAGGKIFITSQDALTTVLDAGPEFKELAENPINEHCQASIAISGSHLILRTEHNLYCIGK